MKKISLLIILLASLSMTAYADTPPATSSEPQPTVQTEQSAAPLTGDEIASFEVQADSLAADSSIQNMQVGAGVDGTIVLSVLVALLIFVVVAAIL
jgi:hypothetical protein